MTSYPGTRYDPHGDRTSSVVAANKICSPKNIAFFVAKVQLLSEILYKFDYNWLIF